MKLLEERTNETGLSKILIKEANNKLASFMDESERTSLFWAYNECLKLTRIIDATVPENETDIDFILNTINDIWNYGVISNLTLAKDEFENNTDDVVKNLRYKYIKRIKNNIVNDAAFNIKIMHTYDAEIMKELFNDEFILKRNHTVFITRGGVVSKEYFNTCIIKPEIIEKCSFNVKNIITIPVSMIIDGKNKIFVMDAREPAFKQLQTIYDVIIKTNEFEQHKIDIRKFKKLSK